MKFITLFLGFVFTGQSLMAQLDTLKPSMGYPFSKYGQGFKMKSEDFPKDLKDSKLFYIEMAFKEHLWSMKCLNCPSHQKINSKVISKMNDEYPYDFQTFSNDQRNKGKQYFLDRGLKYRLLIQEGYVSMSSTYNGNKGRWEGGSQRIRFNVVIENLETGEIFGNYELFEYFSFIKKFVKKYHKELKKNG